MTIELSPEQERIVEQAIEAGLIKHADEVVDIGIATVRQKLDVGPEAEARLGGETDDWSKRLHEWIQSHPKDTPILSDEAISRDSIYGNRGA